MGYQFKQNVKLVAFAVCLFAALFNLSAVLGFLGKLFQLFLPIIVGGILALFLNVPVTGLQKRLERLFIRKKKPVAKKRIQIVSFVLVLVGVILVLALVIVLLVPQLVRAVQSIYEEITTRIPEWRAYLKDPDLNMPWLEELIASINLDKVMASLSGSIESLLTHTVGLLSVTANILVTGFFAIIICLYMVLSKETLTRQARGLVSAYLSPRWADRVLRFTRKFSKAFSSFLTGQCLEAALLGILMFLAFTLFKLPYGSLVGVLTAVLALIPYIGSYITGAISVLLTFLVNPAAVLRCLLVYASVQMLEDQLIYPRIVGSSVGLSPLYTLIAALIGGKLFGIPGMIFFIPLTAVMVDLIEEDAKKRLEKRAVEEAR